MENVAKTSKFNQSRAEGSESSHEPKKKKLRQNNGNGDAVNTTAYVQVFYLFPFVFKGSLLWRNISFFFVIIVFFFLVS